MAVDRAVVVQAEFFKQGRWEGVRFLALRSTLWANLRTGFATDFADKLSGLVAHGGEHGVRLQGVEVLGHERRRCGRSTTRCR